MTVTAVDIITALRDEYTPLAATTTGTDEWSLLTEVPSAGTPDISNRTRLIDVLLIRNWGSGRNPYERIAVEVKVSRSDFFRDTPAKRSPWEALTHRFAYAVPAGLVTPTEVPDGCWLIEVSDMPCEPGSPGHGACPPGRRVHWNRRLKGTRRNPSGFPDALAVYFARRASRAEQKMTHPDRDPEAVESLIEDLRVARRRARQLDDANRDLRDKCAAIADLVAPLHRQTCADCSKPLTPGPTRWQSIGWRHATRALDDACEQARRAAGNHWCAEPAFIRNVREGT